MHTIRLEKRQHSLDTIKKGLQESSAGGLGTLAVLLQNAQTTPVHESGPAKDEDLDTAMDFINSL